MKNLKYIIIAIILFGCNSENSLDCFQTSGDIIQKTFNLEAFSKIVVYERVQLIISQGPQSVQLETGENLENDISISVENDVLVIKNDNACNLVRDYGITKVFVSTPTLSQIRNSSGLTVLSGNTLNFQDLTLISEDIEEEDAFHTDGDFDLDLNVENLVVTQNNLSNFFLRGNATNLDLNFIFGDARFEGRNLIVENVDIYHRGTNDIIINPQVSLTGQLLSTGDLIVTNTPPIIDIEVLYTGQIIYE